MMIKGLDGAEAKPYLDGKIFISTRPVGKSDELESYFTSHGAQLFLMPMIEICPMEISHEEQNRLRELDKFDWVVFTSTNGISCFFNLLMHINGSFAFNGDVKIAVLSKKMASELTAYGHKAELVNSGSTADDLVNDLQLVFGNSSPRVLLPFGNLAREVIESRLSEIANVHRINVYSTEMPKFIDNELVNRVITNLYDLIIFTSPSTFNNFCSVIKNKVELKNLRVASIGSTTTEAVEIMGVSPLVTAKTMNSKGIIEGIEGYYRDRF